MASGPQKHSRICKRKELKRTVIKDNTAWKQRANEYVYNKAENRGVAGERVAGHVFPHSVAKGGHAFPHSVAKGGQLQILW